MATFDGDISADDRLDVIDADMLMSRIRNQDLSWFDDGLFHLAEDGIITRDDLDAWVHGLTQVWYGDANLDGEYNSSDLVAVFSAGEFEDDLSRNSSWATGDWTADGAFSSDDLVVALANGGYEAGQRPAAVPEPMGLVLLAIGMLALRRRR